MRVLVWGLGYVGTVSAACFASSGHEVIGVEINPVKVQAINNRTCSIKEPGLTEIIHEMVTCGLLKATENGKELVGKADISLICVGTPSAADGSPDMRYIQKVTQEIGAGLKLANNYHVVVVRSTVFPGVTRNFIKPILEEYSNKKAGIDFGLVMNPEFLREASAIHDFTNPPYTVIGEMDGHSGEIVEMVYKKVNAPFHHVKIEEAELIKLVNNAFHALKIGFSNEIGRFCDQLDIDSHVVMDMVCQDRKLNISPVYMKPGFAFGGSCLPKDLRSLSYYARRLGVDPPIIDAIIPSNQVQIREALIKIQNSGMKNIGILGLSFKPGTDDLRESPIIELINLLWQEGADISVYDPVIVQEEMLGSNKDYLERQLPQIRQILVDDIRGLSSTEVIIVSQNRPEFRSYIEMEGKDKIILDLVRLFPGEHPIQLTQYEGLSWN